MSWHREFSFDKVTMKNFGGHKDEVQELIINEVSIHMASQIIAM